MKIKWTLLAVTVFFLPGCASIVDGKMDTVNLTTLPERASFEIKDEQGKPVQSGNTPATVVLNRGTGFFDGQTYSVEFTAPGYQRQSLKLDTEINNWYLGNLLFGGSIGFLIVDPLTGAMWDLPEKMNATLTKDDNNPKP